jgi:hypothetical protein
MGNPEDLLQERLEGMEKSESLEASQQELTHEERAMLALASRLDTVAWPERDESIVSAQRKQLSDIYGEQIKKKPKETRPNWFHDWRLPAALFTGIVAFMICGIFTALAVGAVFMINRSAAPIIGNLDADNIKQVGKTFDRLSPSEALLIDLHGLVETQVEGEWIVVHEDGVITEGTQVRTSALSSAALTLKDGSALQIGANSKISFDKLHVDPDGQARQVILTQWYGQSDHDVADMMGESHYEVQTPTAVGQAKGTRFHLRVEAEQTSWYVGSGAVEVSAAGASVLVGAGEMTQVNLDEEPAEPTYFITGQGEVSYIGESWVIAGQSYRTHDHTVIIGNPQVGDIVFFEAHIREETRNVDVIVLIQRNPVNTFTLTGEVQEIDDVLWTINGQIVAVTDITEIEDDINTGDLVRVEGIILADGTLQAERIYRIEKKPGTPFDFTGVVQQPGEESWLISDVQIYIDEDTIIDEGLVAGDLVRVKGWILEGNTWLASSIRRAPEAPGAFEFTGRIESMDPWVVAGILFETQEWTVIDEGLNEGDLVRVKGQVQEDGTWVAFEIKRFEETLVTILIGRVFSIDPWVVSGFELNVDEETVIVGDITLGMLVRVEIHLLADGTQKVVRIEPVGGYPWELGCQYLIVTVLEVDGNQIHLEGWPVLQLDENVEIVGDLKPGSIVKILICFDEEMKVKIVTILIIFTPEIKPPDTDDDLGERGKKVMICHKPNGKNPHIIVVSSSAVPAHLGHGDILGACP